MIFCQSCVSFFYSCVLSLLDKNGRKKQVDDWPVSTEKGSLCFCVLYFTFYAVAVRVCVLTLRPPVGDGH